MKRAAIYPYTAQLLPVVRYFERLQQRYLLKEIYSLPGSSLAGRDAAYACNYPPINRIVSGDLVVENPNWETLILVLPSNLDRKTEEHIFYQMKKVLALGKSVVFCASDHNRFSKALKELENKYSEQFIILEEKSITPRSFISNKRYGTIDVPVVLIGGLVESSHTTEVLYALSEELQKQNICPALFTRHPIGKLFGFHTFQSIFINSSISEEQKILEINRFTSVVVRDENPDLILVEAPGAVMKFNEIDPNGFGILTYILTQALTIDFFICSVPLDLAVSPLLEALSQDYSVRLGTPIHAVQVSNIIVDSADMLQKHKLSYVHHHAAKIIEKNNQEARKALIPLFDVVQDGCENLVQILGLQAKLPDRE